MLNKLVKSLKEELIRYNCHDNNNTKPKNFKEIWLSEQIKELQPYKSKFFNAEINLKKLENELELYKNKCNTLDDLHSESRKTFEMKSEEIKDKLQEIRRIEANFSSIKEFIFINYPNKTDRIHQFLKRLV